MNRLWNSVLVGLVVIETVLGASTVTVDCMNDVVNQKISFTVTGTLGTGNAPTTLSIDGCATQVTLSGGVGVFDLDTAGADGCTNADWGTYFILSVQEFPDVVLVTDEQHGVLCTYDTSTLTPSIGVSVSSLSTIGTTVGYITPTMTLFFTSDADCTTAVGPHVKIGTAMFLCAQLDAEYIKADGFDLKVKDLTVEHQSGLGTAISLTTAGCVTNTWFGEWQQKAVPEQGLVMVGFTSFLVSNAPTAATGIMPLVFKANVEVCKVDAGNLNCGGYTGCAIGSGTQYRKKRDVFNETNFIGDFEVKTSLTVVPEGVDIDTPGERSLPATSDDVCLQKGGFYGLIIFFVLALLSAVLASCFLFMRSRRSGKYVDERHMYESGSQNPSFRG